MSLNRKHFLNHQRIVVKIGSSSLTHPETGRLDLAKLEILVRQLTNLHNMGKDIILVSSGAIMVGSQAIGLNYKPHSVSVKQACASIGQARLMMIYQKLFSEYNQVCSQILLTKHTMIRPQSRFNTRNTFAELLDLGVIPIVNENDTISTEEIEFGDNDRLSAVVAALVDADLLILLSDIDGLFTEDPRLNPEAALIETVDRVEESMFEMAGGAGSKVGTGGMITKLKAAQIASAAGAETIIANGKDFHILESLIAGEPIGTLFKAHKVKNFDLLEFLDE